MLLALPPNSVPDSAPGSGDLDLGYMRQACLLALRAGGGCRPNPMVGAVVVRGGEVVGRGYHRRAGGAHAEVEALTQAGSRAEGATLYVTLEPCNHQGRTPPCTEAVLAAKVRRVVIGMRDPNPHVQGGGIARLTAEGLEIRAGVLEEELRGVNAKWLHWLRFGTPQITRILPLGLDGRYLSEATRSADPAYRALHRRLLRQIGAELMTVERFLGSSAGSPVERRRGLRAPASGSVPSCILAARELTPELCRQLSARFSKERGAAAALRIVTDICPPPECIKSLEENGIALITRVESEAGHRSLLRKVGALGVQGLVSVETETDWLTAEEPESMLVVYRRSAIEPSASAELSAEFEEQKARTLCQVRLLGSAVVSLYRVG